MRKHYERILHDSESRVQRYLDIQILDENSPFCGGFPKADSLAEPKTAIYRATTMTACYLHPESRYYLDAELGRRLTEMCLTISTMIRRERTNSSKEIAESAKQFISENYQSPDISVEMLCDHLHVSPAYFSTLFKKETGMSFVAYLTQVRMDEAVKLLSTTEDKTYEISLKVGYTEPNYFSYVFKKQFGMSPTKYRSSQGAAHD